VLVDEGNLVSAAGIIDPGVQLPGEWISNLLAFISASLPGWRDDPQRPSKASETGLTAQLCGYLNGLVRHSPGWDFLQFRREEPDDVDARRSIDLIAAPSGTVIFLGERSYTQYETLLPIECKRLPTPAGTERDEREYLFSQFSSTGGVHRFKAGYHGGSHPRGAMIAYIQDGDIPFWQDKLEAWITALVASMPGDWKEEDRLHPISHDTVERTGSLRSEHDRPAGLGPISLDHLWVQMT
jgi:hypothetical protein